MRVLKFGGTSVGSIENMIAVRHLIDDTTPKIVVLSAMSGTTNALKSIAQSAQALENALALQKINTLQSQYDEVTENLFTNKAIKAIAIGYIDNVFAEIERLACQEVYSQAVEDHLLAQGELLSTFIFTRFLEQEGVPAVLLPALDFMRIDRNNDPDQYYIQQNLDRLLSQTPGNILYITQGFICRDYEGRVSNLQRGGSDYTATIVGAAVQASEVQIWTDIDGFHNNDPRFVEYTKALPQLSYDEAAELAYFGAKILHPQTVAPLRASNIPLRLKNTMDAEALGTSITLHPVGEGVKAIAAKDGITAIKIRSGRMLQSHGFLSKVFEIFERYQTSIDMITTSEVAISLTIDDETHLESILQELLAFSQVSLDKDQSIICLVGNHVSTHRQTPHLFKLLNDVQVRMISYGGSNHNISLLVATQDKPMALQLLQKYMFQEGVAVG